MPHFTTYRLVDDFELAPEDERADFGRFADFADHDVVAVGPQPRQGFSAMLYTWRTSPHPPPWSSFVQEGFGDEFGVPMVAAVGALLVLRLEPERKYFAFAFGSTGRFLLRAGGWRRGYGLKTAVNLIYPRGLTEDQSRTRLVSVDAKRRGPERLRSRTQASHATTLEALDLDRYRDVMDGVTGRPHDKGLWGMRMTGADALSFGAEVRFPELGNLCRRIDQAHARDDYKERFQLLDDIKPVTDPELRLRLCEEVTSRLRDERAGEFDLAPPEILDHAQVAAFRFYFDGHSKVQHPDLLLAAFLTGLKRRDGPEAIEVDFLRSHHIAAISGDGQVIHRWPAWRCLSGDVTLDNHRYVLDEGDFFEVSDTFCEALDEEIGTLDREVLSLPDSQAGMREDEYNKAASEQLVGSLCLDRQLIRISSRTTPVELCDILAADRKLIHVKRHLGSADLSHLFLQGHNSATLLQDLREFRQEAHGVMNKVAGRDCGEEMFPLSGVRPSDYEVVYAIVARWHGRSLVEALPFFSKLSLRHLAHELKSRGFQVACQRIPDGT